MQPPSPGVPAVLLKVMTTHRVEKFVKLSDDSSNLSDIHTSLDLRAAFTQSHR